MWKILVFEPAPEILTILSSIFGTGSGSYSTSSPVDGISYKAFNAELNKSVVSLF